MQNTDEERMLLGNAGGSVHAALFHRGGWAGEAVSNGGRVGACDPCRGQQQHAERHCGRDQSAPAPAALHHRRVHLPGGLPRPRGSQGVPAAAAARAAGPVRQARGRQSQRAGVGD
eukprot:54374-Rhodomonas_salina.1